MSVANAVARIFDLIIFVLLIDVLLSWIPSINWRSEPFKSLKCFSDIFFSPFRKIIPPIGMIDISPIVAFFCLSVLRNILVSFVN